MKDKSLSAPTGNPEDSAQALQKNSKGLSSYTQDKLEWPVIPMANTAFLVEIRAWIQS
jgi:hypothetical protein